MTYSALNSQERIQGNNPAPIFDKPSFQKALFVLMIHQINDPFIIILLQPFFSFSTFGLLHMRFKIIMILSFHSKNMLQMTENVIVCSAF